MDVISHPVIFTLLGMPIRDTVVMTWIAMALMVVLVLIIKKTIPSLLETLLDFITSMVGDVLDVDNLTPYLPLLGSLFIFIAFSNLLSVIPGLRSPTADINTTFSLALVVFFAVHFYGIRQKGLLKYLLTFSDPIFLFPIELLGHLSRTLSLTLRLFGNIMSGDLIVAIVVSLVPLIIPVPFILLGMVTGILQAFIMTTLATLYIASAVEISNEDARRKQMMTNQKKQTQKENSYGKS